MNRCCANSHMSLPSRTHTLRTSLYTPWKPKPAEILYYRYFYMWTHVVRTHICLCPCECSQLEPHCIHAYTQKYTYIISYHKYFYMWTHVVRTHICLRPCECSQLEPLCIHRYSHKYTYFILQILLNVNPCCANSHMSVPLRVLALRTSLYTYTYTHKYTYIKNHITDTLVYQPVLCTLTLVCALASAHT